MPGLKDSPSWPALMHHRRALGGLSLRSLFERDPHRFRRFSIEDGPLLLDYSKHWITGETVDLLLKLAHEAELEQWRERLFAGEIVNTSEQRPALHMALRAGVDETSEAAAQARHERSRMGEFVTAVREGRVRGAGGEPITDVIHIGIGGSDLGPRLAVDALGDGCEGPRVHFCANLDGVELRRAVAQCRAANTLVVVVSKSFTTAETLANGRAARAWLLETAGEEALSQLVAVTAKPERAAELGISEERVFAFWDWVGGRYSLWSTVGISVALRIGMDAFEALLAGAAAMDAHFRTAPLNANMPVLLGLLGIWYTNAYAMHTRAVVPYCESLKYLPSYLQQLEMESNGKDVDRDGRPLDHGTAPAVWGQTGTVGQHAFFQALHQGVQSIPVEFVGVANGADPEYGDAEQLLANLLAQSNALMRGRTDEETRAAMVEEGLDEAEIERLLPYRRFTGGRPSTTILMESLTPDSLGRLLALHEHKTFVQGVLWRIDSFDQWGVELGKTCAKELLPGLSEPSAMAGVDASTRGLAAKLRAWRGR